MFLKKQEFKSKCAKGTLFLMKNRKNRPALRPLSPDPLCLQLLGVRLQISVSVLSRYKFLAARLVITMRFHVT